MKPPLVYGTLICMTVAGFAQIPPASSVGTIYERPEQIALKHPTPPFPKKARAQHVHGTGVFTLAIDEGSGQVIDVKVLKSTGYKMLDDSAVDTLKRWEFPAHVVTRLDVPITFTWAKR